MFISLVKVRHCPWEDLDTLEVREILRREILEGLLVYNHFGSPCRAWALANTLNGGTRRNGCPDGSNNPLPREQHANSQAKFVFEICLLLSQHGGWWTVENPRSSYLFLSKYYRQLCTGSALFLVLFDQCSYGLKLPGGPPRCKSTSTASNFPEIHLLERKCPGLVGPHHQLERAWGLRKIQSKGICKTVSLSRAAGAYPPRLC